MTSNDIKTIQLIVNSEQATKRLDDNLFLRVNFHCLQKMPIKIMRRYKFLRL